MKQPRRAAVGRSARRRPDHRCARSLRPLFSRSAAGAVDRLPHRRRGVRDAARQVIDALTRGENFVALAAHVCRSTRAPRTAGWSARCPSPTCALNSAPLSTASGSATSAASCGSPPGSAILKRVPDAEAGAGDLSPASAATSPMASAITPRWGRPAASSTCTTSPATSKPCSACDRPPCRPDAIDDLRDAVPGAREAVSSAQTLVAKP